ncbi:hypothetical protein BC628DRAFT_21432 [Trametes gibbosa]|nr:hypothetical protein BC628DRAFT_21432 [Trametes gibbosa]
MCAARRDMAPAQPEHYRRTTSTHAVPSRFRLPGPLRTSFEHSTATRLGLAEPVRHAHVTPPPCVGAVPSRLYILLTKRSRRPGRDHAEIISWRYRVRKGDHPAPGSNASNMFIDMLPLGSVRLGGVRRPRASRLQQMSIRLHCYIHDCTRAGCRSRVRSGFVTSGLNAHPLDFAVMSGGGSGHRVLDCVRFWVIRL